MTQWVNEISRFTLTGTNKVLVYHGSKRERSLDEFSDQNFVITTYSVVEAEYRKYVLPEKQICRWCGKLFHEVLLAKQKKSKNAGVDVTESVDDGKLGNRGAQTAQLWVSRNLKERWNLCERQWLLWKTCKVVTWPPRSYL